MAPKTWSKKAVDRLLENIKHHPCVYNNRGKRNDSEKESAWKEIASSCLRSVSDTKKKWKGLKDTYIKRKKALENTTSSAADANGSGVEPWAYFITIHQLYESIKIKTENIKDLKACSDSNSNQTIVGVATDIGIEEHEDEVSCVFVPQEGVKNQITTSKTHKSLKRKRLDTSPPRNSPDHLNNFSECAVSVSEFLHEACQKPEEDDDIAGFMLIIKNSLKRIPLKDREEIIFTLHGEFRNVIKQYHLEKNINGVEVASLRCVQNQH